MYLMLVQTFVYSVSEEIIGLLLSKTYYIAMALALFG